MKFLGVASILLSILFGTATRNCSAHEEGTEPGDALQAVTVNVYPLAYYDPGPGKKPWGGCDKVPITVGGYPHGTIRVGVFESILGGTGQLWRATSWQAALTASQLLDFDPHAMQVAVSVEGKIDGPSAGALFTVGILAAVRGDQLNEEVTMTGTINPDGTIGPVGGIAYKLEGAAQAGKKTVLIPAFTRLQYDEYSKEHIDLVEHGKKQGLTVHQVNDVWEAYELFTGKKLPRHKEITLPMVSSVMSNHLRERTKKWIELQSRAHKAYSSWDEDRHSDYADDFLEGSEDLMKRSLAATLQGEFASAYWDAVISAAQAWNAHEMGRYYHAVENEEDWEGTRKLLFQDDWLTKEVDKTASAMRFYRPTTLEQVAVYMGACEAFYEGLCYKALSEKMRNIKLKDEDENTELILTTAEQQLIAWLDMMLAMDYLELANSYEGRPVTNDEGVVELAKFYEHCAIASLTVVDEIEVKRVGSRYGLQQDSARAELMYRDVDYAAARLAATEVLPNLHNYFGTGPQYNYARLSATTMLHTWSAMLIAKYYSLGIETDEYYNIIGVRSEKTLTDWLEDSRGQANRAIGSLIDNGIDATTCLQLYSVARTSEGRGEEDRLDALEGYFNVNVTAQVLRRLAGVKGVGN